MTARFPRRRHCRGQDQGSIGGLPFLSADDAKQLDSRWREYRGLIAQSHFDCEAWL
jgi:hypothetical protein